MSKAKVTSKVSTITPAAVEPAPPTVRGAHDTELARRLGRALREAMGEMSQTELARRSGIDQPTISKLLRGVRLTSMTVWEMMAMERACGVPAGWMLSEAGYLSPTTSARNAIMGEVELPMLARKMLLAALAAALAGEGAPVEESVNLERLAKALLAQVQSGGE